MPKKSTSSVTQGDTSSLLYPVPNRTANVTDTRGDITYGNANRNSNTIGDATLRNGNGVRQPARIAARQIIPDKTYLRKKPHVQQMLDNL